MNFKRVSVEDGFRADESRSEAILSMQEHNPEAMAGEPAIY